MATASPDARPGPDDPQVLGDRYELGDVLGRGGMADVHRATDRLLHRDVAVKVMRDLAGDDTARARFRSEARTLAGLSHHGLVTVLDAGLAGPAAEQPYLVLELVEGSTLGDEIARGPVSPDRVREVGAGLADTLAYAHDRGVVHRDVKPGNVLLGSGDRVKLTDFGIAKLIGDTSGHTRTGTTIGSAAYLSPEQVRGEQVTGAADIYALGLLLLEALTGERAFSGPAMEAAVARLHRAPEVPEHLPDGWRALLASMLDAEPAARPAAADVAARLRAMDDASAGTTRPLTGLVASAPPSAPWIDRTGEAVAGAAVRLRDRAVAMPDHQRALVLVGAVLVLFLVLTAVVAGGSDGGGGGTGEVPQEVPRRLEQPLQDLHDAVDGQTP
ncbi:protein kinase domain-containing protein [Nocardioides coralli]|uniref:protein kinase domain-containing protein n=1 Tax=Nocardioides coralli TaxID=2872154 RepID=UPI001CA46CA2|nr:protein kinase [Nocardioides coralli]QZY29757.1 protein kinase [Nocardioides coralli]